MEVSDMAASIARWQFSVTDYVSMREVGILREDDNVELIDGEVRPMAPIGPFHAAITNLLVKLITQQLGDRAIVSIQNPVNLNMYSQPQPDIAVLQPRDDFYVSAHPRPDDILLVIEVADSSLEYDRSEKLPRYAQAGIPEAWIVDISKQTIEQYTSPQHERYHRMHIIPFGDRISATTIDQLVIAVQSLFR
jgi:Uma2 family endonuclease